MARKLTSGQRRALAHIRKAEAAADQAASATPPTQGPTPYAETLAFLERVAADFAAHADRDPVSADTVTYCRVAAEAVRARATQPVDHSTLTRLAAPTGRAVGEKVGRWNDELTFDGERAWDCEHGSYPASCPSCGTCGTVRPPAPTAPSAAGPTRLEEAEALAYALEEWMILSHHRDRCHKRDGEGCDCGKHNLLGRVDAFRRAAHPTGGAVDAR